MLKSKKFLGAVVGVAALACVAMFATAQDTGVVNEYTPNEGTIGTQVVIDGAGFGTKKPKVFLTEALTKEKGPKKYKLKVTQNSDMQLTCTLKKAPPPGFYTVNVQPKGGDVIQAGGGFRVRVPGLDGASVEGAQPGDSVQIFGNFFGSKKPKVFVGRSDAPNPEAKPGGDLAKAKVTAFDNDSVTITLGKKTPGGIVDVVVQTKVGIGVLFNAFNVAVPAAPFKGKDFFLATIVGKFKATTKPVSTIRAVPVGATGVSVNGTSLKGTTTQTLTVVFGNKTAPENLALPFTFTGESVTVVLGVTKIKLSDPTNPTVSGWASDGTVSVTITNASAGRISGTFTGTLDKTTGPGADVVTIKNGKFEAERLQP